VPYVKESGNSHIPIGELMFAGTAMMIPAPGLRYMCGESGYAVPETEAELSVTDSTALFCIFIASVPFG
jgi:hypothetical protein